MKRIGLFVWALTLSASSAMAVPNYYAAFTNLYSFVLPQTRLATRACAICHDGPNPISSSFDAQRNPYGLTFGLQPQHGKGLDGQVQFQQAQSALRQIEGIDSDGDGVDNGTEIKNLTYPGDPNDPPPRPAVRITAPGTGIIFTRAQTVMIQASASDVLGISKVEFYEDNVLKGTAQAVPYVFGWTISAAENGPHLWTARAYDTARNVTVSEAVTLTVEIDVTPPVVSILSLHDGNNYTLAQTIKVQASATDNVGVTRVEFYDNGTPRGTVSSPPFEIDWTFTALDNGPHIWSARAYDAGGNTADTNVTVTVSIDIKPPSVKIAIPDNQTRFISPETIIIQADATDDVGVSRVEFYDNGILRRTSLTSPYLFAWTFTDADNGTHTWDARAYDAAGNTDDARIILTVEIDVMPPTVVILSPSNNTSYDAAQTVTIRANATDNVGVTSLGFYDNGVLLQSMTAPPYVYMWTIDDLDNGPHSWSVRAEDAAGNSQTSGSVHLNVQIDSVSLPRLAISQAGPAYTLSWFGTDTRYVLQRTQNLGASDSWTDVPMAPPVVDAINRIRLPAAVASLRAALVANQKLALEWNGDGQLQTATSLSGPWTDLVGASSPLTVSAAEFKRFYRLKPGGQVFYRLHRP